MKPCRMNPNSAVVPPSLKKLFFPPFDGDGNPTADGAAGARHLLISTEESPWGLIVIRQVKLQPEEVLSWQPHPITATQHSHKSAHWTTECAVNRPAPAVVVGVLMKPAEFHCSTVG